LSNGKVCFKILNMPKIPQVRIKREKTKRVKNKPINSKILKQAKWYFVKALILLNGFEIKDILKMMNVSQYHFYEVVRGRRQSKRIWKKLEEIIGLSEQDIEEILLEIQKGGVKDV